MGGRVVRITDEAYQVLTEYKNKLEDNVGYKITLIDILSKTVIEALSGREP
jgi:hypothetical protein